MSVDGSTRVVSQGTLDISSRANAPAKPKEIIVKVLAVFALVIGIAFVATSIASGFGAAWGIPLAFTGLPLLASAIGIQAVASSIYLVVGAILGALGIWGLLPKEPAQQSQPQPNPQTGTTDPRKQKQLGQPQGQPQGQPLRQQQSPRNAPPAHTHSPISSPRQSQLAHTHSPISSPRHSQTVHTHSPRQSQLHPLSPLSSQPLHVSPPHSPLHSQSTYVPALAQREKEREHKYSASAEDEANQRPNLQPQIQAFSTSPAAAPALKPRTQRRSVAKVAATPAKAQGGGVAARIANLQSPAVVTPPKRKRTDLDPTRSITRPTIGTPTIVVAAASAFKSPTRQVAAPLSFGSPASSAASSIGGAGEASTTVSADAQALAILKDAISLKRRELNRLKTDGGMTQKQLQDFNANVVDYNTKAGAGMEQEFTVPADYQFVA